MVSSFKGKINLSVGVAWWTHVLLGYGERFASPFKMSRDEPAAGVKPSLRDGQSKIWLFKEEPNSYSYDLLVAEGETLWDGVDNALARIHLRAVKAGDCAYFYQTGSIKAIVGVMEILSGPMPVSGSFDEKAVAVRVRPLAKLPRPVTLAEIKADPELANWDLVRNSRLSVMPVERAIATRIDSLAQKNALGRAIPSKGC